LALMLSACGGSDHNPDSSTSGTNPTIVGVASQKGFTALLAAATKAGLANTLSDPAASLTVLAPTDAAFTTLATQLGFADANAMVTALDAATLKKVLTYHVVSGKKTAADVSKASTLTTLYEYPSAGKGSELTVSAGTSVKFKDAALTEATVASADVMASNGVVHAIDKVLVPPGVFNVVEMAQVNPSFSTLVAAVKSADLVGALSNASGTFTVFAPTDSAFTKLLAELKVSAPALLADKATLTQVLTYHVLGSKVAKAGVPLGKAITTLQGGVFKIEASGTDVVWTDSSNRTGKVVATDVMASNGIIHVVDTVLLPTSNNLVALAQSVPDLSILVEAVVAADLQGALAGTGPFTVFAPTNAAFAAALAELGITKAELFANKALLTQVLTYHVVSARALKADITPGAPITSLQGGSFTIGADLAITDANGRKANIAMTDVFASNGVAHVIDKVILPK